MSQERDPESTVFRDSKKSVCLVLSKNFNSCLRRAGALLKFEWALATLRGCQFDLSEIDANASGVRVFKVFSKKLAVVGSVKFLFFQEIFVAERLKK